MPGPDGKLSDGPISTYAGNYTDSQETLKNTPPTSYGGDTGLATNAKLYVPIGIALDAAGDLFIADSYNNRVREVYASNEYIYTVAGTGKSSYNGDGKAAKTNLNGPSGVAVEGLGSNQDLFIADTYNNLIREVTPGHDGLLADGTITTVAGEHGSATNGADSGTGATTGTSTSTSTSTSSSTSPGGYTAGTGPATGAKLHFPQGIFVTGSGDLYFADTFNNAIREVSGGTISTVAGDHIYGDSGDGGLATAAVLGQPFSLTLDDQGNIFIADTYNNEIREVNATHGAVRPSSVITTVAGGDASGYSPDRPGQRE